MHVAALCLDAKNAAEVFSHMHDDHHHHHQHGPFVGKRRENNNQHFSVRTWPCLVLTLSQSIHVSVSVSFCRQMKHAVVVSIMADESSEYNQPIMFIYFRSAR